MFIYDDNGHKRLIADQLAIIALATNGFVGLIALMAILLLPPALFLRRFSVKQWAQADVAPLAAIAVILNLYLFDCMVNGMLNPLYVMAAGGVLTIVGVRPGAPLAHHDGSKRGQPGEVLSHLPVAKAPSEISIYRRKTAVELGTGFPEPQENLALRYQTLGRDLKAQGRPAEAKAIWLHALDLWAELATTYPDHPLLHQHWCDCANDLAWLLANASDQAVRDSARAIALAGKAAEVNPNCATYWNTLGAAHYRARDFNAAITTLSRAIGLTEGGTAFDHVFLAMAHAQLGDQEQAEHSLDHARLWMEQYSPDHSELTCLCDEACYVLSTALDSSVTVQ
jgi:hypothetical protein